MHALFDSTPSFNGFYDSIILYIASFTKFVVDFNIFHEDDLMRVFVCTLEDDVLDWHDGFGCKEISSIVDFFQTFLHHWHDEEMDKIEKAIKEVTSSILVENIFIQKKKPTRMPLKKQMKLMKSMKNIKKLLLKILWKRRLMFPLKHMLNN